tara:strand:- start:3712 stop:3861 length:150 start_codon:yes stop_codon:yes gene_type:complete
VASESSVDVASKWTVKDGFINSGKITRPDISVKSGGEIVQANYLNVKGR